MTVPTPPSPQHGRSPHDPSRQGSGQSGTSPSGAAARGDAHAGPYDPWAAPPSDAKADPLPDEEAGGALSGRAEIRDLLLVLVALTLAGGLLGLLWWRLAPPVEYISDGANALLRNTEAEDTFAVDGTFALLALGLGVLSGLVAFLVRRSGGVGLVLGLAVGAVLGSVAGWRLGVLLGPGQDLAARAVEAGRGGTFDAPLQLGSVVVLLAWPLAAVATHLLLLGFLGPRDPEPQPEPFPQWAPPPRA
ncbi:hypothetical protein QNO07_11850 [Streptomyces sp. 549]|uniref:hypothetical protein n=1 Tax=Streptomyces sp. 549 TaxID=3049076 RepID=UPI0024C3D64C|nr:hypothetical protein [Streptomyces sp. 549]MDK1474100.1 hypothetical protein [Streptomyces sp. 549]